MDSGAKATEKPPLILCESVSDALALLQTFPMHHVAITGGKFKYDQAMLDKFVNAGFVTEERMQELQNQNDNEILRQQQKNCDY